MLSYSFSFFYITRINKNKFQLVAKKIAGFLNQSWSLSFGLYIYLAQFYICFIHV